jgi:hypothetical protein
MRIAAPLLLALVACATARPPVWVPTEATFKAPASGFELEPPPGWMRRNFTDGTESFIATRDGTPLQRIVAGSIEPGKPLGIGGGKRTFAAGMSTAELSELVVDDLRALERLSDFAVLENAPATLGGRSGFHVVAAFREEGLARRTSFYGVAEGSRLYWLFYVAPQRHYFARDEETFARVVRSFRLTKPAAGVAAPAAPADAPAPG